jgi:outer membrane protein assembly factor BamB
VAVAGDVMVAQSLDMAVGLAAYRLTPAGAQKLWSMDLVDRGASPIIHDGYVYTIANSKAWCIGLEDGKVAWSHEVGYGEISSPVLADGKIYALTGNGKGLVMFRASPAKFELLGKAQADGLYCTSPALARGRLYVRTSAGVACYDLTGAGQP